MSEGLDIGHLVGFIELDASGVDKGATEALGKVDEVGALGKVKAAAAGLGIATALASTFTDALDVGASRAKLTAQLDLNAADSKRLGGVAGDMYSSAYGESLGDVNEALRLVIQNVGGMADASDADLERVTGKVMSVADAFDQDLGGVTRAVGQMLRTGLAKDADEALDVLTKGFQNGTNAADDLVDTFAEYSTQFRKLGIDSKDALGLMSQGLQAGARDSDIVADSLKELSIRAIDGSETTAGGFAAIGLSAGEMGQKFAAGGKTAREALDLTLDRLRAMPPGAERSAAAVALFGTQAEDLGAALFALDPSTAAAAEGMDNLEGAADRVNDTLGDTAQSKLTALARTLKTAVVDLIGDTAVPVVAELAATAGGVLLPALDAVGTVVGGVVDVFTALPEPVRDVVLTVGALVALRGPIAAFGTAMRTQVAGAMDTVALRAMYARDAVAAGGLTGAIGSAAGAARGAVGGFGGLAAMMGGPLGIAIAGVSIGLPLLTSLFSDNDETAKRAATANSDLASAIRATGGAIDDTVRRAAAKSLQDSGILDMAEEWGVASSVIVDATLGSESAMDEVTAAAQRYEAAQTAAGKAEDERGEVIMGTISAHAGAAIASEQQRKALQDLAGTTAGTIADEKQLAKAQQETGGDVADTTDKIKEQQDSLKGLKDLFDDFSGRARSVAEQEIRLADGLQDMTDRIKENGTSLDRNTQAGRNNYSAVLDQIGGVEDLASSVFEQTGSMEAARDAYRSNIDALRDHLKELGYNADEVDGLIERYGDIPEEEFTRITQPGMTTAQRAADILRDKVLDIPDDHTIHTSALTGDAITSLESLGYKVRTLDDGTVEVVADTQPARDAIAALERQRFAATLVVNAVRGAAPWLFGAGGAVGGIVQHYAAGGLHDAATGVQLTPMSGGLAQVVPPGTFRVIGDRPRDDEFFIPDDDAPRSYTLAAEWARRHRLHMVPLAAMADGGQLSYGSAAAAPAAPVAAGESAPALVVQHMEVRDRDDVDELAEAVDWKRRTRGRRR